MPVNTDILSALEERKRKFGAVIERVGDIFLDRINLFKLYAIYCSNQRAVTVRIQELKGEVPDFKAFCAVAHKKAFCRGMCLPDFLIAPLQRLCKYPLVVLTETESAGAYASHSPGPREALRGACGHQGDRDEGERADKASGERGEAHRA